MELTVDQECKSRAAEKLEGSGGGGWSHWGHLDNVKDSLVQFSRGDHVLPALSFSCLAPAFVKPIAD